MADILIKAGADIQVVRSEDGNNAMHILMMNFQERCELSKAIARKMIQIGVNVNKKNKNDMSPLHLAAIHKQSSAIEFAFTEYPHLFDVNLKGGPLK